MLWEAWYTALPAYGEVLHSQCCKGPYQHPPHTGLPPLLPVWLMTLSGRLFVAASDALL